MCGTALVGIRCWPGNKCTCHDPIPSSSDNSLSASYPPFAPNLLPTNHHRPSRPLTHPQETRRRESLDILQTHRRQRFRKLFMNFKITDTLLVTLERGFESTVVASTRHDCNRIDGKLSKSSDSPKLVFLSTTHNHTLIHAVESLCTVLRSKVYHAKSLVLCIFYSPMHACRCRNGLDL